MKSHCARLLVLEDSENFGELITELLEGSGWEIDAFSSGPSALAAQTGGRGYDVLLVDVNPGSEMSGIDFVARYRLRPEGGAARVILMSGTALSERAWRVAGAVAFLLKPFSIEELQLLLRRELPAATSKTG